MLPRHFFRRVFHGLQFLQFNNSCSSNRCAITFPDFVANACCNPCCPTSCGCGCNCGNSCGCGCNCGLQFRLQLRQQQQQLLLHLRHQRLHLHLRLITILPGRLPPRRLSKNLAEDVRDRAAGGVCGGAKSPPRVNQQDLKLFESFKIRTAGRKYFFDTLRGGSPPRTSKRAPPSRPGGALTCAVHNPARRRRKDAQN